MALLFVLAIIIICIYDGVPLFKKKQWGELITMGFLMAAAVYLGIAQVLDLSTPIQWLELILAPLSETFHIEH